MSIIFVGTCSQCGGAVVLQSIWMSTRPQIPTCERCGAKPVQPYGPVIKTSGGREGAAQ